jgi:hypothetical protein
MHRGGNAIFRFAWECVCFLAAPFLWDRHSLSRAPARDCLSLPPQSRADRDMTRSASVWQYLMAQSAVEVI